MTLTRSIHRLRTEVNLLTTRATGEQRARLRLAADALADALDVDVGGGTESGTQAGHDARALTTASPAADVSAQRCPTCGSDDPMCCARADIEGHQIHPFTRHNVFSGPDCCRDPFHYPDEETHRREHRYPPARPGDDGPLGGPDA